MYRYGSRVTFDANPIQTSHLLTSDSHKRKAIVFFPPLAGQASLLNEKGGSLGQGINLVPGQSPIYLTEELYGDMVSKAWFVTYAAINQPIGYAECMA